MLAHRRPGQPVYERPATAFVADFLGKANMLAATVSGAGWTISVLLATGQTVNVACPRPLADGSKVTVAVRPQKLSVGTPLSDNRLSGRVVSSSCLSGSAIYEIDVGGTACIPANAPIAGRVLGEGEPVALGFGARTAFCLMGPVSGSRDASCGMPGGAGRGKARTCCCGIMPFRCAFRRYQIMSSLVPSGTGPYAQQQDHTVSFRTSYNSL